MLPNNKLVGPASWLFGPNKLTQKVDLLCHTVDLLCQPVNSLPETVATLGQQVDNVSETVPINLGNPVEFSIIDLAKKIIQLTKSSSKLKFLKLPEDDPVQRCPDIINAKKLIKWEPKIDLESGLIKTVDYFKGLQYD